MLLIHTIPGRPGAISAQPGPLSRTGTETCGRAITRRRMEGAGLWLAVAMVLFLQPFFAEASLPREGRVQPAMAADTTADATAGVFEFRTAGGSTPAVVLETEFEVTVSGLLAETRLRQTFANVGQEWREGVYLFPLPDNATVHGFRLKAGDRVIDGDVQERVRAERTYQQARAEGRQVARVDQQRPNLFTTHMANIPPGESVTVEVRFQQPVRYQNGEFELHLPTTLTPRYMPGIPVRGRTAGDAGWAVPTDEVPDAHLISPATVHSGELDSRSHMARVNITVDAGLPLASVSSPSHEMVPVQEGERVRVTPRDRTLRMDRDLILRWTPVRGAAPRAVVFHERWQGEDYLLTLLVPGEGDVSRYSLSRELTLIIDTSGSMAGEPMRQARLALLNALDTLGPDDRFNVIQFNSHTHGLFAAPVPADRFNLDRARHYVRGLSAGGGTVMAPALNQALAAGGQYRSRDRERVRQVVFITDGAVGNEQALLGQIRRELDDARLFTVGIGAAPNRHFLREAARHGRGSYTQVAGDDDLADTLGQLFSRMESPVLTDLRASWPAAGGEAFPARPGDLFAGEPLVQVSRGVAPQGDLMLSARVADPSAGWVWQQPLALSEARPASGLHRLWAREKVGHLQDSELGAGVSDSTRREIVALGIAHQIMTPYTSFVAVDRNPVRDAEAALVTESLATLMPAGTLQRIPWPGTSTAAPLLIRVGLAGLFLALLVWLAPGVRRTLPIMRWSRERLS